MMFAAAAFLSLFAAPCLHAKETDLSAQQGMGFYKDLFNDNIYYEFADYLNVETLYRKLTHKKIPAGNQNIYDEVPDSSFFTNRHARKRLTADALEKGSLTSAGPDLSGSLTVISGESNELHPRFFVRDGRGDIYLLKFDAQDSMELGTGAEVVGNRFYYALGYNVAEASIITLTPGQIVTGPKARYVASTGFTRSLTPSALQDMLLFIPYNEAGKLRASAMKVLEGVVKGPFGLRGHQRKEPGDAVAHENLREIRALRIFTSWLNHYDLRSGHTVRTVVEKNGQREFKNYLLDASSSLGSGYYDAKPPMFTFENAFDYGEVSKAFFAMGLWEKPWQKQWREVKEKTGSPAFGYFENRHFNSGTFKTQLPGRAFKNLTRADGFWAAKIIMTFKDDDIRSIVKAAAYSHPEDAERITKTLSERRDKIGRYWFSKANPLDAFDRSGGKLVFTDLAVDYGFESAEGTVYRVEVTGHKRNKKHTIASVESREPSVTIDPAWFAADEKADLVIRILRPSSKKPGPYVTVGLSRDGLLSITHQD